MSKSTRLFGASVLLLLVSGQITSCQSNDFEGKQTLEQVHCQQAGGEMINRPTGIAYTTEYVCKYPTTKQIPIEFRG